ncbi:hypothetical protein STANM309S_05800 [Streptomyces tanashiensis]
MTTPTIKLKPSLHRLSVAPAILANPGFGRHFTDHMVTIKWTEGRGWHDGQLVPYAPASLDPATMVLHYAQDVRGAEGLPAARRLRRHLPPGEERRALPGVLAPPRHARASGGHLHRGL